MLAIATTGNRLSARQWQHHRAHGVRSHYGTRAHRKRTNRTETTSRTNRRRPTGHFLLPALGSDAHSLIVEGEANERGNERYRRTQPQPKRRRRTCHAVFADAYRNRRVERQDNEGDRDSRNGSCHRFFRCKRCEAHDNEHCGQQKRNPSRIGASHGSRGSARQLKHTLTWLCPHGNSPNDR